MVSLASIRASNANFNPSYRPTALFVGGTSGIGEGTVVAFARATKGNAHILICGRNRANAERIIQSFPKTPQSQYDFIECDATLMKNVVKAAEEIKSRTDTLNYIVQSQGALTVGGFQPTKEGIDDKFALHFYSRFKFVDELLPCLQHAVDKGQEARVMSILGAAWGGPLNADDFGLKKNYSFYQARLQHRGYTDIMVKEYSARYPQMSFTHIMPGFVVTPLQKSFHWAFKPFLPLLNPFGKSIEESGEWMLSALLSPAYKQGGFHLDQYTKPVAAKHVYCEDGDREKLAEHYEAEVATALAS